VEREVGAVADHDGHAARSNRVVHPPAIGGDDNKKWGEGVIGVGCLWLIRGRATRAGGKAKMQAALYMHSI
jgi:hypothetical protein